jgi:hypothetical protein
VKLKIEVELLDEADLELLGVVEPINSARSVYRNLNGNRVASRTISTSTYGREVGQR